METRRSLIRGASGGEEEEEEDEEGEEEEEEEEEEIPWSSFIKSVKSDI